MYLLDTVALSQLAKKSPDAGAIEFLRATPPDQLYLSVVSLAEIVRGIAALRVRDRSRAEALTVWLAGLEPLFGTRCLPVTADVARRWGFLMQSHGRADLDVPIAATALVHGLTVVTRNVRHFAGLGVRLLNPFA